jgi:chromosome segregation ATPase
MDGDEVRTPQAELEAVRQEIAELEPQVVAARRRIGERDDSPTDAAELAQLLTEVEQQEAVLAMLKGRRDEAEERLRGRSGG